MMLREEQDGLEPWKGGTKRVRLREEQDGLEPLEGGTNG